MTIIFFVLILNRFFMCEITNSFCISLPQIKKLSTLFKTNIESRFLGVTKVQQFS
jgi:hypothetical protein